MILGENDLPVMLEDLSSSHYVGFDTETYGLQYHDRLFSLILSLDKDTYYLNFNSEPDHKGVLPHTILDRSVLSLLVDSLGSDKVWVSHNAMYDIQKLNLEGLPTPNNIHCTYVSERLIRNDSMDLSLKSVAKKYGFRKDASVDEYITKHKLYTQMLIPGKNRKEKVLHFDLVPFDIITKYGETDAIIHKGVGLEQIAQHFPSLLQ